MVSGPIILCCHLGDNAPKRLTRTRPATPNLFASKHAGSSQLCFTLNYHLSTLNFLNTAVSSWLERFVRSFQFIAIHILLVGNDTGSRPIPPNERESEFL
jgi:hypothetical protein